VAAQPSAITRLSEFLDDDSLDVIDEIAPNDGMYKNAPQVYFEAGRSALRCIRLAMLAAKLDSVGSVLDFACAHGRVLRALKAAFPDAALTACDIRKDGVEFCSRVFGATGVISKRNPAEIDLDGPFDLIWCGSLLTHVEAERWVPFLKLFESVLSPGGVVVFTTYGRFTAERLRTGKGTLNLTQEQIKEVLRDFDETGFGFHTTRADRDCIASPAWVCNQLEEIPGLRILLYFERGWLRQDAIACVKAGE
jgi:2-polyprenyl-3-methyl-5-hydroxy-6-metoxy-1,4-benzoquinol methylase